MLLGCNKSPIIGMTLGRGKKAAGEGCWVFLGGLGSWWPDLGRGDDGGWWLWKGMMV